MSAVSTAAADAVGKVLLAKGAVSVVAADGSARFIAKGSEVASGETVVTAEKSFVVIEFTDGTKTTLRPDTEFVIEKYSHRAEAPDEAVFDLVRGGMRAVSGLIGSNNPDGFRVNAGVASMGIRGTAWDVRRCEEDCASDNERLNAGRPSAAEQIAETKCLDTIDLEGIPEGAYFAVYNGRIVVFLEGESMLLGAGDAGYAGQAGFGCLSHFPTFMFNDPIVFPDQVNENTPGLLDLQCQ
jgi:hypothetical protein